MTDSINQDTDIIETENKRKPLEQQKTMQQVAALIEYPQMWDTDEYPTLADAVYKTIEDLRSGT